MLDRSAHHEDVQQDAHAAGDVDSPFSTAVDELVAAARRGEQWAWQALVERFRPLVRSIARRHRLGSGDVDDVDQTVWLRLVENLERIREPRALPGWLATTASNESLRVARRCRRTVLVDPLDEPARRLENEDSGELDANLLRGEVSEAIRRGLAELPSAQRELLTLLVDDRLLSYREISTILAIPVGSIGPTRARGLARLRATVGVREYLSCWHPQLETA